jgi:phenylpropionate dioxygenase-like ring-hydroxylating dioxygenase large terminal subunit
MREMIEPGRVHRDIYLDPEIFEIEMDRIFGRAWIYVGHDSQTPDPGDFITTSIGRQPVVMSRHTDGEIYVLFNKCGHRGAIVCNDARGNAKKFQCLYHGWVYNTDGTLRGVPLPEGYPRSFKTSGSGAGMGSLPRVASYRGFVFASLNPDVEDLESHLGPTKACIDNLCDRAPDGEIMLTGGMHRYRFDGNWKLQLENTLDSYHVPFAHESTVDRSGKQFSRREGDAEGAQVTSGEEEEVTHSWKERGAWAFDHGHGFTGNTALDEKTRSSPVFDEYKAALAARLGEQQAEEVLTPFFHNALVYPNMSFMGLNMHIRVIKPIAVDRTEVNVYPVLLKGAPHSMNQSTIKLLNVTHAAASFVQTDDLEAFARCQRGVGGKGGEWVYFNRGLGEDTEAQNWGGREGKSTQELVLRNQYNGWLEYMGGAAP